MRIGAIEPTIVAQEIEFSTAKPNLLVHQVSSCLDELRKMTIYEKDNSAGFLDGDNEGKLFLGRVSRVAVEMYKHPDR